MDDQVVLPTRLALDLQPDLAVFRRLHEELQQGVAALHASDATLFDFSRRKRKIYFHPLLRARRRGQEHPSHEPCGSSWAMSRVPVRGVCNGALLPQIIRPMWYVSRKIGPFRKGSEMVPSQWALLLETTRILLGSDGRIFVRAVAVDS